MASVSKLVLMPINTWHRLSKDMKYIDVQSMKTVEIPSVNQLGARNVPPPPDPLARPEDPVVWAGSLSLPLPLPSPQGGGRRGRGRGKEEGAPPKYIDREDTGKEKTLIEKTVQISAKRRHVEPWMTKRLEEASKTKMKLYKKCIQKGNTEQN